MRTGWRAGIRVLCGSVMFGAAMALAACGESVSLDEVTPVVGVSEVEVQDSRFTPRVTQVPKDTEIRWVWTGNINHNVIGDGWGSEIKDDGEYAYTFPDAGTFDYVCTLHRGMTGRVIVVDE